MCIYIISIALQLAGALILFKYSALSRRNDVIKRFVRSNPNTVENNYLQYDKEEFRDEYRKTYLSKLSFAYIAAGYIIGIFAYISDGNRFVTMIIIIVLTAVIIITTYLGVNFFVNHSKNIEKTITAEEFKKSHNGIYMEILTPEKKEELFKEINDKNK